MASSLVKGARGGDDDAAGGRQPAYVRIEQHLWTLLDEGAGVSEPMPAEVDLAREFGVSVMTVRQAYNKLVSAGAVVRRRFKGTWAVTHLTDDLGQLTPQSFPEQWRRQAQAVDSEVLALDLREAPHHVATRFEIAQGTAVTYLERRRRADGVPVAWDTRWMPPAVFRSADAHTFEQASVFAAMDALGTRSSTMQSEISARIADPVHAEVLECEVGEALLVRQIWCRDAAGITTLVGTSLYPSTRFSFRSTTALAAWHYGSEDESLSD